MKRKFNSILPYIPDFPDNEFTKETVKGLFRSILEPLIRFPQAEACVLLKLSDTEDLQSLLRRIDYSGREIYSFSKNLEPLGFKTFPGGEIFDNTDFLIISAKRYSAALLWDYSTSSAPGLAQTALFVNSKIITDILNSVLTDCDIIERNEILKKYNADRRENRLLNSAVSNIASAFDDKNRELAFEKAGSAVLNDNEESVRTAKIVENNARFIAHEIKNNISIINLYLKILNKRLEGVKFPVDVSESVSNALETISHAGANINTLICSLRSVFTPDISEFNIKELIESTIAKCEEKFKSSKCAAVVENTEDISVASDKTVIEGVITNVLFNASEACENGGQIRVYTETDDNFYNIFISNNGKKIPEEAKDKIFEPGYTSKSGGNGLGLAICKQQMLALGGDIVLVSSGDDETLFEIKLALN